MAAEISDETIREIASHYEAILKLLGEDTTREGLVKTPMRAAKAMVYATRGYRQDPDVIINDAVFSYEGSRMVIVKDIEFYSLCEHHILPFFGKVSVGYIPDGKTIGLSKLARLVDFYGRRLQVQERMTAQICNIIMEKLNAKGRSEEHTSELQSRLHLVELRNKTQPQLPLKQPVSSQTAAPCVMTFFMRFHTDQAGKSVSSDYL